MFGMAFMSVSLGGAIPGAGCAPAEVGGSRCSVSGSIGDDGVTLTGNQHNDGTDGGTKGSKHKKKVDDCNKVLRGCDKIGAISPGAPGNPGITISDIKNFKATSGNDHMQPNGWMVVGLDTNFYSVVGTELVGGSLLGNPATVRFTPESWHWTYGDGSSATHPSAGRTWAALHVAVFDRTPTSHVYQHPGTYYIDLDITFRADYRYAGGPWIPVIGTLTLPANRLRATAGYAKTVLVNRDCTQDPAGPGC